MVVEIPSNLPVGFRFHPTDDELITSYLRPKIAGEHFDVDAIAELDLCRFEPWELPHKSKIKSKDRMWWFLCQRDYKNPRTRRSNRTTKTGFWKITGQERKIMGEGSKICIGRKRTLVFHSGPTPGKRTNWVMQEISLDPDTFTIPLQMASFVICRLKKKSDQSVETPEGEITPDLQHLSPPPATQDVDHQTKATRRLFSDTTEEPPEYELTADDIRLMSDILGAGPSMESPEEFADTLIIDYQDETTLLDDPGLQTTLKRSYFGDAPGGSDTEAEGANGFRYFQNVDSQLGSKRVRELRVTKSQSKTLQTRVASRHFVQEQVVHSSSNGLTNNKPLGEIESISPVTPPLQGPKHVAAKTKPIGDQKIGISANKTSKWSSVITFVETSPLKTRHPRPPSEYWLNAFVGSVLLIVFVCEVVFAIC